jgi:hypothetical protein
MSKTTRSGGEEEEEDDDRATKRGRSVAPPARPEDKATWMPNEMWTEIALDFKAVRPLLRFARTNLQSSEVVSSLLDRVFARDILSQLPPNSKLLMNIQKSGFDFLSFGGVYRDVMRHLASRMSAYIGAWVAQPTYKITGVFGNIGLRFDIEHMRSPTPLVVQRAGRVDASFEAAKAHLLTMARQRGYPDWADFFLTLLFGTSPVLELIFHPHWSRNFPGGRISLNTDAWFVKNAGAVRPDYINPDEASGDALGSDDSYSDGDDDSQSDSFVV